MSNEINMFLQQSGYTVYVIIFNKSGQVYNTSSESFEALNASNWTDYDVSLTEQGSSGVYLGNFPTAITTAGSYDYYAYRKAGASPAQSDARLGPGTIDWTGSTAVGASVGSMTGSDFYNYFLRKGFKRTDKSTEVYEAITDAVQIMRRKFGFDEAKTEADSTDTITTDGDYQLSLESDNGMLLGVMCQDGEDAWELSPAPNHVFNALYPDQAVTSDRGTPSHFTVVAGSVKIGPVPDKTTYLFRLYYSKRAGTVTSSTTAVPFTDKYRDVLADCVNWLMYKGLESFQLAQYYESQFENRFKDMMIQEVRNNQESTWTMRFNDVS